VLLHVALTLSLSDPVPVAWDYNDPAPIVDWAIYEYDIVTNPTLGIDQIIWSDIPMTIQVEESVRSVPSNPTTRPLAYYIPASWTEVIEALEIHGIELEVLEADVTLQVVNYRMNDFAISNPNREGRATAQGTPISELCTRTYKMNDVKVLTDQPLGTLAVSLLEPTGEGSFFYWGFFNSQFTQAEYGENYIMVPIAEMLLEKYPEVSDAWRAYKLENPDYAEDPSGVIDFFFSKTAFSDSEAYVYPVGIELSPPPSIVRTLSPSSVRTLSPSSVPSSATDSSGSFGTELCFTFCVGVLAFLI
jgi:hypothetical protein